MARCAERERTRLLAVELHGADTATAEVGSGEMKVAVAGIALTRTKLDPRYYYRDYLQGVRSPAVAALPDGTGGKPKPAPVSGVRRKLRNLFIKSDEEAPTPRSGSA